MGHHGPKSSLGPSVITDLSKMEPWVIVVAGVSTGRTPGNAMGRGISNFLKCVWGLMPAELSQGQVRPHSTHLLGLMIPVLLLASLPLLLPILLLHRIVRWQCPVPEPVPSVRLFSILTLRPRLSFPVPRPWPSPVSGTSLAPGPVDCPVAFLALPFSRVPVSPMPTVLLLSTFFHWPSAMVPLSPFLTPVAITFPFLTPPFHLLAAASVLPVPLLLIVGTRFPILVLGHITLFLLSQFVLIPMPVVLSWSFCPISRADFGLLHLLHVHRAQLANVVPPFAPRLYHQWPIQMSLHVWPDVKGGSVTHPLLWIQLVIQCLAAGSEIVHSDLAGPLLPNRLGFGGVLLLAKEGRKVKS